jgi:hypothetical protein
MVTRGAHMHHGFFHLSKTWKPIHCSLHITAIAYLYTMKTVLPLLLLLLWVSCASDGEQDTVRTVTMEDGRSVADVVKNPVTPENKGDTINVPRLTFAETSYDFGKVKEGAIVEHGFVFTNTGKEPLIIGDAKSTCGCTVPEYPKEPIAPGARGVLKVRFDTKGKEGFQSKPVTVTTNGLPSIVKVTVLGQVETE